MRSEAFAAALRALRALLDSHRHESYSRACLVEPKYQPAHGSEIEITLHWTDAEGKPREVKAQDWVQNFKTKQAMSQNWVFAGSGFVGDKEKGQQQYQGENGNLICVANFTDAVFDLPVPSTAADDALLFAAFTDRTPPLGTPVTIVLTPKSRP